MTTIYRVLPDVNEFQHFLLNRKKTPMMPLSWFDGTRIGEKWVPPHVYSPHPLMTAGDFWGLDARSNTFAVAPRAEDVIRTFLDQSAELLPFVHESLQFNIVNVTYVVNCLDRENSTYWGNLPSSISKYEFHEERIDEFSLFKIPETRITEILTVEGRGGPETEFKPTVEMHGLKGLKFVKLWSDDD